MRELLPLLQNHLHDTSEKVRIAFLELLLLVKGMRMVKFWHIAPLEHLLGKVVVNLDLVCAYSEYSTAFIFDDPYL